MILGKDRRGLRLVLGAVCVLILCILLTAGLWPFCAPKNGVAWIAGKNGLQFGRDGIVASADSFSAASPNGACTLEILLEPAEIKGSGTIVAFDSSRYPKLPFALKQFWWDMAMQGPGMDRYGKTIQPWLATNRVFQAGQNTMLTITGKPGLTVEYVNGLTAKVSKDFGLNNDYLTGRLVLGSSTVDGSWSGQITGFAVYDSALSPADVQAHSERWLRGESPVAPDEKSPVALYRFTEGSGDVVHDESGHGHDLAIASRYFVLHPQFLQSPIGPFRDRWSGWRTWSYWGNVCLNVAGFVPMGFFFTAYFSLVRPIGRPRIEVIAMGLAVSLTIEIGQYFLPTRDSGINDLITNTFGTAIGVVLCSPGLIRRIASKFATTSGGPVPS